MSNYDITSDKQFILDLFETDNETRISESTIKELVLKCLTYKLNDKYSNILKTIAVLHGAHYKRIICDAIKQIVKTKSSINKRKACTLLIDILYPEGKHIYGGGPKKHILKYSRKENSHWSAIPSTPDIIIGCLENHPEYLKGTNFIDIGCGAGDKVIMTSLLSDMMCHGLEYDFVTYSVSKNKAKTLPFNYKTKFYHDDAFKFDFSSFDRIYTYRPVRDEETAIQFYEHIFNSIKVGTMWLECMPCGMIRDITGKRSKVLSKHPYIIKKIK